MPFFSLGFVPASPLKRFFYFIRTKSMDCAHTIVANIYRLIPFSVYLLPAIDYALFDKPMIRTTSPPFHKSGSNLPPHPSFAEDSPVAPTCPFLPV